MPVAGDVGTTRCALPVTRVACRVSRVARVARGCVRAVVCPCSRPRSGLSTFRNAQWSDHGRGRPPGARSGLTRSALAQWSVHVCAVVGPRPRSRALRSTLTEFPNESHAAQRCGHVHRVTGYRPLRTGLARSSIPHRHTDSGVATFARSRSRTGLARSPAQPGPVTSPVTKAKTRPLTRTGDRSQLPRRPEPRPQRQGPHKSSLARRGQAHRRVLTQDAPHLANGLGTERHAVVRIGNDEFRLDAIHM